MTNAARTALHDAQADRGIGAGGLWIGLGHWQTVDMTDPVDPAIRAIARRTSYALALAQFGIAHLVMLGGMGLLLLYQPISAVRLWILVIVSQALVMADTLFEFEPRALVTSKGTQGPVTAWALHLAGSANALTRAEAVVAGRPVSGGRTEVLALRNPSIESTPVDSTSTQSIPR